MVPRRPSIPPKTTWTNPLFDHVELLKLFLLVSLKKHRPETTQAESFATKKATWSETNPGVRRCARRYMATYLILSDQHAESHGVSLKWVALLHEDFLANQSHSSGPKRLEALMIAPQGKAKWGWVKIKPPGHGPQVFSPCFRLPGQPILGLPNLSTHTYMVQLKDPQCFGTDFAIECETLPFREPTQTDMARG